MFLETLIGAIFSPNSLSVGGLSKSLLAGLWVSRFRGRLPVCPQLCPRAVPQVRRSVARVAAAVPEMCPRAVPPSCAPELCPRAVPSSCAPGWRAYRFSAPEVGRPSCAPLASLWICSSRGRLPELCPDEGNEHLRRAPNKKLLGSSCYGVCFTSNLFKEEHNNQRPLSL